MAFLDQEAKQKIHQGSLDILSDLGVRVDHEAILNRLEERGAKVDRTAKIARLPESLVEWALKTAPSSTVLADRRGRRYTPPATGRPVSSVPSQLTRYAPASCRACTNILTHCPDAV